MEPVPVDDVSRMPAGAEMLGSELHVVLRASGCMRVAAVAFMLFWLGGWAFGEFAAAAILLRILGIPVDLPVDVPPITFEWHPVSIGIAAFLIFWLVGWTAGGITAIATTLRLLFGRDTLILGPSDWSVRRSYGLFTRTRTFHPDEGWHVTLQRRDRHLVAYRGKKRRVITELGTPEERRWLRDEVERRYPQPPVVEPELPDGFEVVPEEGGRRLVRLTTASRMKAIGCGIVLLLPLAGGLWFDNKVAMIIGTIAGLIALAFIGVREEMRVGQDLLERRFRFFLFSSRSAHRGAKLAVEHHTDSDNDEHFSLFVIDPDGRKKRLKSTMNDPTDIIRLARFYAKHTGWPLDMPREVSEG